MAMISSRDRHRYPRPAGRRRLATRRRRAATVVAIALMVVPAVGAVVPPAEPAPTADVPAPVADNVPVATTTKVATTAPSPEPSPPSAAQATDGDHLRVYLMTMGPGDAVWERFGHNAIWIHDAKRGTDVAYNWGIFDFEQEGFIRRFLMGRMLYSMAPGDADWTVRAYASHDRSVWVQELNLTSAQKLELQEFLEWNQRPENRDYRYDYYRDNCSTRVRDALDMVLGGQLWAQTGERPAGTTYREHTRRLTAADPLLYTGLNLAMGPEIDRPLSVWDEMFLPLVMREHVRSLTVIDEAGREVPLVLNEVELYGSTRPEPSTDAAVPLPWFLAFGVALGGTFLGLGLNAPRRRAARIAFATLSAVWAGVVGVLGAIITMLWAVTDHAVTYGNENVLQANPFVLGLAVLIPLRAAGRAWAYRPALRIARVVAGMSILGFVIQALPGFDQINGEIIALILPVHLGLALALERWPNPAEGEEKTSVDAAPLDSRTHRATTAAQ